jgi:hypothetical protein
MNKKNLIMSYPNLNSVLNLSFSRSISGQSVAARIGRTNYSQLTILNDVPGQSHPYHLVDLSP